LFDLLDEQTTALTGRGFLLDAAASPWNAKCVHYFTEEVDSLTQDWSAWPTIFCNAPFSAKVIERFAKKAIEAGESGSTVVLLLPLWPGYPWFQDVKRRGHLQDIIGPVCFERADGSTVILNNGNKTMSLVVVTLGPRITPRTNGEPIVRRTRNGGAN
jgi:phage N-6-adenine-methyltransferase